MKMLALILVFMCACSTRELKVGDCFSAKADGKLIVVKIVKEGKYSFEVVDEQGNLYTIRKRNLLDDQVDCFGVGIKKDVK